MSDCPDSISFSQRYPVNLLQVLTSNSLHLQARTTGCSCCKKSERESTLRGTFQVFIKCAQLFMYQIYLGVSPFDI